MFIRPATIPDGKEGAGTRYRVRDPITFDLLSEAGEHKPTDDYWLRRLQEGGVEEVEEPAAEDDAEHDATPRAPEPEREPEPAHENGGAL